MSEATLVPLRRRTGEQCMWVSRRVRRQSFMRHFQIDDQRDDRKVERSTGEQNWMDDSGNFSPPMTSPFLSTCNRRFLAFLRF
ncbi:hypothetical protein IGI04_012466 [Brassica rapa subsp. trilocularis]|uniref:Uncharacterized protein n=1 Tax=Brassica rapa subsp. trilocularis TaxID=1813537 RepID=A0ABQ7N5Z6_BRACM|nr:hypothetical protein IGI04_012466 [Brassica rapa subsp. trilocularis]